MNTNNFKPIPFPKDNFIAFMFQKQKEIFLEYMKVEGSNWNSEEFSIDCLEDQELMKEFAWRITEELTEMSEDWVHADHVREELVDTLNFLLEFYIIYGWTEKDLPEWYPCAPSDSMTIYTDIVKDYLHAKIYGVIESLGQAINILKGRKWKQQHYLVDLYKLNPRLQNIWKKFNMLVVALGITDEVLFSVWSQKYQCNAFRLKSRY